MTLSEQILDRCTEEIPLSPEQTELLKRNQNVLTAQERAVIEELVAGHVDDVRRILVDMYKKTREQDVHNVDRWAAVIVGESNERGYLCEFDEIVLRILNDPSFDQKESERIRKRWSFSGEWTVISRGVGMFALCFLVLYCRWYFPISIACGVLACLAALAVTFFWHWRHLGNLLSVFLGTVAQVIIGVGLVLVYLWRWRDVEGVIWILVGYAVIFFAHGLAVPLLERFALAIGKRPSLPFQGR